jgi:hypothetical protein
VRLARLYELRSTIPAAAAVEAEAVKREVSGAGVGGAGTGRRLITWDTQLDRCRLHQQLRRHYTRPTSTATAELAVRGSREENPVADRSGSARQQL